MEIVLKVDAIIEREAAKRGLIHVDGKEFALGKDRKPVLVDSFGTLDEDRWWDAEAYERGEIVQLSRSSCAATTSRRVTTMRSTLPARTGPKSPPSRRCLRP